MGNFCNMYIRIIKYQRKKVNHHFLCEKCHPVENRNQYVLLSAAEYAMSAKIGLL